MVAEDNRGLLSFVCTWETLRLIPARDDRLLAFRLLLVLLFTAPEDDEATYVLPSFWPNLYIWRPICPCGGGFCVFVFVVVKLVPSTTD